MDSAKSDWLELCDILALPSSLAQKWWSCLCKYYGDSVRHYHTMNHIFDMLNHLRKFKDKFQSSQEVSLAIFFHE